MSVILKLIEIILLMLGGLLAFLVFLFIYAFVTGWRNSLNSTTPESSSQER